MKTLSDKVVIITGASSGIGEATANILASKGAKVVLAARRIERLKIITDNIIKSGNIAVYYKTDVTNKRDVEALVNNTLKEFGQIDVLINNAGIFSIAPLKHSLVDEWDKMIDVNIKGLLYGIAYTLPIMKKRGKGHIINIASIDSFKVIPNHAVYCATKHAVKAISEGIRIENNNIKVTNITPGLVKTEASGNISNKCLFQIFEKEIDKIALEPKAIANAIAFSIEQPYDVDVNEIVIRPRVQKE
jgi:NADP-dependent 3-hydroxy acid dehydrogenase YdfG